MSGSLECMAGKRNKGLGALFKLGGEKMNEKLYKFLEWVRVLLPLFTAAYTTISKAWNWPYLVQIVATLSAIDGFICGVMKYASKKYFEENDIVNKEEQEELKG